MGVSREVGNMGKIFNPMKSGIIVQVDLLANV
jgi:hypothetical protein